MVTNRGRRWLGAVLAVLAAGPAAAQSVRAVATDAATGAPVAEAMVRVEAADGSLAAAGFTDEQGTVVLRVRRPGTYRVQARRSGYTVAEVAAVEVGRPQAGVAIAMTQRPFALDTVVVYGQRRNERGRQGFERRRSLGLGVFLDSAYLEQRSGGAAYAGDLLRGVPGLYVERQGRGGTRPRSQRGWRCMVMLLDGVPVPQFRAGTRRELSHIIGPRDVKAVEVYREWSEVPPEFQQYASEGIYNCGVYLYWTRASW
ncbi:MAG TPA: TonB-dependent receptor [Longimicrobium sp.]|jgi:hypothetical protein|uniref:carboxypeptidase-like regulatory domain-containing protein n=1 Tax=Longimicrobium sp. TaxID=2029185 RepID=UPI002ED7FCDD